VVEQAESPRPVQGRERPHVDGKGAFQGHRTRARVPCGRVSVFKRHTQIIVRWLARASHRSGA
jgi:hypothetical protein